MLMNISSAVATLTVIVIFSKWKFHNFRLATFLTPFILLLNFLVTYLNCDSLPFVYAMSISLRYVSDIGFSIFLIWAIEAYPTVCRTRCVGMVFCGISLGTSFAYALGAYPLVQMGIGLVVSLLAVWASKYLRLDHRHRLKDTLSNKDYDRQDQFRRVCKGEE